MKIRDGVKQYAEDCIANKIVSCKWIKLQCKKVLDDFDSEALEEPATHTFHYYFDDAAAQEIVDFIEMFTHVKGDYAGQHIKLEEWQKFFLANVFGWKRKRDDLRRYRTALLMVSRKNGKSLLAAIIALYMLTADNEAGAEVYCGATSMKQAQEIFRPAQQSANKQPDFQQAFDLDIRANEIFCHGNDGKFQMLIRNPGDGASPHAAFVDEYHQHQNDNQYNTLKTGMGSRSQPILFVTSTAGTDISAPFYSHVIESQQKLEGIINDEQHFSLIYTADSGDEWVSDEAIIKANPNLDISVSREYLENQRQEAINIPRKQSDYKTKHLNIFVQGRTQFFDTQKWIACGDPTLNLDDYKKKPCLIGFDLASKRDLTALVLVFPQADKSFRVFSKFYLPESAIKPSDTHSYCEWVKQGFIQTNEGNLTDYNNIISDIEQYSKMFDLVEICGDSWNATQVFIELQNRKLPIIEVRQTVKTLSEPTLDLEAKIFDSKIIHDGNPAMSWCISNVVCRTDAKGCVFPTKQNEYSKIDGAAALLNVMSRLPAFEQSLARKNRVVRIGSIK